MGYTSRFTKLLGECRRQMNGAVVGSMRYYGAEYGLNYGVSIPTLRSLAATEGKDHQYAKYLYQQQVREIRLISFYVAEPAQISTQTELDFWAKGIINSEVAEEAAFALFQHVDMVTDWLKADNDLLIYTAILSLSKSKLLEVNGINNLICSVLDRNSVIITTATITLLEKYYIEFDNRDIISKIISELPSSPIADTIRNEMQWRMDCYV